MSPRLCTASLLLPIALLLGNQPLFSADPVIVSGILADPSGAAIEGGSVRLYRDGDPSARTAQTARDGTFRFSAVGVGDYLLDASAPGLGLAAPIDVHVEPGKPWEKTVTLAVVPASSVVTVTGSNAPQSIDETSKAIDSIDLFEASRQGSLSLADALGEVPGLRISVLGGPGSFTTIQTRGLRATDTAILFDSFRLRDATGVQGDASALIADLLLVDSSRAEVLRGSGSSLYGTNSMGGTVNILTDHGGGPMHGDIDVLGGGLGLFKGTARVAGGAMENRLTFSAGFTNLNVTQGVDDGGAVRSWLGQGYVAYALTPKMRISARVIAKTGYVQIQSIPYPADNVPATADGIIPAIGLTGSQLQLANQGLPFSQGNATFIPALNDPDARLNENFAAEMFRWEYAQTPKLTWHVDYQLLNTSRDNLNGPGGSGYQPLFNTSDKYDGRVGTLQARVDYLPTHAVNLSGGYEFEHENYLNVSTDQNPDPTQRLNVQTNASQQYNAGFLQSQMRFFGDRLQILLSGRYQQVSLGTPEFTGGPSPYAGIDIPSPRSALTGDAALAYFFKSTNTKLRAHVGNSFRMPSLYERFGSYFYGGYYSAYGDPRLSPERAVSGDAGIDQYLFRDKLRLSASYFYSHLQQVIGFDFSGVFVNPVTDPYGRYGGYYNTGGGIARGVEISGEFRPARSTRLFASYTYTNALDRYSQYSTGTGVDPLQSPRIMPNVVTVSATQQFTKRIDATLSFYGGSDYLFPIYSTPYRFDGLRQLNLSAGYELPLTERLHLRFSVRVANALNQLYYEQGFKTPAVWVTGGVSLVF